MITPIHEDYLKTIYTLQEDKERVSTNELAERLGVSAPSATSMVQKLAELKMLEYEPYRGVRLTLRGEKVALRVIRLHRLVELYLAEALGLPWNQVHEEAEKLEHVLSEILEERISAALGHPTIDPHGDPIPDRSLCIEQPQGQPLTEIEAGRWVKIIRVLTMDNERLSYLGSLGLYPNTQIRLLEKAPFNGPLTFEVGGDHYSIASEMADRILVKELKDINL
ncbi:MAG: metal-dependent transcriptional regulator [Anaerolineales bacterium]|nr:metal-dependent transcriptional regulator [Anaerolineales bacterium]